MMKNGSRLLSFIMTLLMVLGVAAPAGQPIAALASGGVSVTAPYAKVVASDNYSFAIMLDDSLWGWGSNNLGQLGDGSNIMRLSAVKIMDNVDCIDTGGNHALAVAKDGSLWLWGSNDFGQLGNGTKTARNTPEKLMDGVKAVAAGRAFSMAVKTDGSLWTWGHGESGRLGNGTTEQKSTPEKIMDGVISVAASENHSLAIKSDNTLWSWGNNSKGQVGDGTTNVRLTPVKVLDDVVHVAAGNDYTMAIKSDGSLWAWGNNGYGCLGDGGTGTYSSPKKIMDDVADVACGFQYSLILKTDGGLLACGYNSFGQLGNGTTTNARLPIMVLEDVADIACGTMHSLAVLTDGSLWGWGSDSYGQMGDGYGTNYSQPVKALFEIPGLERIVAGDSHVMALDSGANLWVWGDNTQGQVGDGTNFDRANPKKIMGNVADTAGGSGHTLALQTDGSLWAWGNNNFGQVGDNATGNKKTPVKVLDDVIKIACGNTHSLAIRSDNSLWGWGGNGSGQLGNGTTQNSRTPIKLMDDVLDIAGGYLHTVILKTDGSLWTCGYNYSGQIGDGSTTNRLTPVKIIDSGVASIAASANRTQALMTDGSLWIWGDNSSGQVGDGSMGNKLTPVKVMDDVAYVTSGGLRTLVLKSNPADSLWVWGAGPVGDGRINDDRRLPVKIMDNVASVATSYSNTFVIDNNGVVWCWGGNWRGILGYDSTMPRELMPEGSILPYNPANRVISSIVVGGVIEPVAGGAPFDAYDLVALSNRYKIDSVSWTPAAPSAFVSGVAYSANITLLSLRNYKFIGGVAPIVNGGKVAGLGAIGGGDVAGNTFTFTVDFEPAEDKTPQTVEAPIANPASGAVFSASLTVTLTTATTDAEIYYTTDGSNPTAGVADLYIGAITITNSATIRAVARKAGMFDSDVATFTYTLQSGGGGTGGGGSGGGGSGGGGSSGGSDGSPATSVIPAADGSISVAYSKSGATVVLSLPDAKLAEIIGKAKNNKVFFDLSGIIDATQAIIPKSALSRLAGASLSIEIDFAKGSLTLDADAAKSAAGQADNANIGIGFKEIKAIDLNSAQQKTIRGKGAKIIAINIYSDEQKLAGVDGVMTVKAPYDGTFPVAAAYIDEAGELVKLESVYDAESKTLTFTADKLGAFAIFNDEPVPITPVMPINPFEDVYASDWFIDDVIFVYNKGLMNGTNDNPMLFSPEEPLTRGMMVTILYRLAGSPDERIPAAAGGGQFNDVYEDEYYYQPVNWAVSNGIVIGYDGRFEPENNITREQIAVILHKYCIWQGIDVSVGEDTNILSYNDAFDISEYAIAAMQWACGAGIYTGKPGELLDPLGDATRAEFAAVLARSYNIFVN